MDDEQLSFEEVENPWVLPDELSQDDVDELMEQLLGPSLMKTNYPARRWVDVRVSSKYL